MEELDLKELFFMFWNKKLEIILITLMFVAVGIGYSYFFVKPEYTSTTSLVLAQSSSSGQTGDGAISATDLTMNSKLVSTYSELIKRKAILGQVCENLNIPDSNIQELRGKIKVNSAKNTEIIEISVTNKDPNIAAAIANEIAKPLRRNDSALAYLPTQFITEFIKSNGYAGVAYTSTMRTEGINVAVFDESIFECVAVHTVEINNISYSYEKITYGQQK